MPGASHTAVTAATQIQIGEETTAGTAVASTRQILAKQATMQVIEELEPFEGQMHGTLARVVNKPRVIRTGTEFEFTSDLDFEQVLLPLLSGMVGAVTPSTPEGNVRLWVFAPSTVADPLIDTYTLEWVTRNLDASPDEYCLETPFCFCTGMEITIGEGIPQLTFQMVGRRATAETKTGGQSIPTILSAGGGGSRVYVDNSWANLGTNLISGQIYGFTWAWRNFLRPAYYLEGRNYLDFSNYEYGPRVAELTIDTVIDPTAASFYRTEVATKATFTSGGTPRYIQAEVRGPLCGGSASYYYTVQILGCYYHASDSMTEIGRDREGNPIVRMHLLSAYDSEPADITVNVINITTAFP